MEKISHPSPWPEIVFGSSDSTTSQMIRRAVKAGELRKLAPRLYTSNLKDTPENIVKRNLYHILGGFFPGAILSHRTAIEGGPSKEGTLVLSYRYTKKFTLPGLNIKLLLGPKAQLTDTPFMDKLFLASRERALLENLQPSRTRDKSAKTLPRAFIEEYLNKICSHYGVEELNRIRDRARPLAKTLNMPSEFQTLEKIIGALLGTQKTTVLQTEMGLARAKGIPYDVQRLELFANLATTLNKEILPVRKFTSTSIEVLNNLAFFEAYFSNFIEGTKFEVDEAADIIFRGHLTPYRPEDAHDILGTFQIVSSLVEMHRVPSSAQELMSTLKARHAILMSARTTKEPGKFKRSQNRAGNTIFVHPDLVEGTIIKAFDLYKMIEPGIARAMFMMFLIAEIHPFLDGNGRIARIMMNAELVYANQWRIIIPTVFREDYILTLRRLTRDHDVAPYIRMLIKAQTFTASIDYGTYAEALNELRACNAFLEPSEGKLILKPGN